MMIIIYIKVPRYDLIIICQPLLPYIIMSIYTYQLTGQDRIKHDSRITCCCYYYVLKARVMKKKKCWNHQN